MKPPVIRKITKPSHRLYVAAPHIEHGGFVALAGTEVFHLGQFVFVINVILLVTGSLAVLYEHFQIKKDNQDVIP